METEALTRHRRRIVLKAGQPMLAQPETQARFAQLGMAVAPAMPAQFKANRKSPYDRRGGIVRTAGLTPSDRRG